MVANNAGGNGTASSEVNATALFSTPPTPITNSVSNIAQTSMRMNWASSGGTTNDYIIKCQSGASAPAVSTGGTVVALTYYDYTSLTANTMYTCSVWSRNANATPGLSSTYLVIQGTTLALPTVAITSPAASSYVNNATKAAFAVSGTCSENGRTVSLTGAATGSATCTSNAWSTSVDVSAQADGNITLYADLSSASGSNATQSSRIFVKDIVAPPTLTTFTAVTHASTVGANTLTLTLPGTTTDYNNIKTYRSAQSLTTGTTAPACGSGTLINTTTSFVSSPVVLSDGSLNPNSYYAYRVCIYDAAGNLENTKTAVDVRAKGYVWNYWFSADDADGDGNISSGSIAASGATTWTDKSGNARNATLTNFNFDGSTSGWLGDGSVGNPYRVKCDGINDYVLQNTGVTSRTYAYWYKPENNAGQYIMATNYNTNAYMQANSTVANISQFRYNSGNLTYIAYEPTKWYHMVSTFDGTNTYFYQNGVLIGTQSGISEGSSAVYFCSSYGGTNTSNISVGEVMASATYLAESDVRNLYESTRSKYYTSPGVPTVERIYPANGPSAGGTTVKVSGYLLSTTTGVTVGGNTASYSISTDGFMTITTPAGTAGYKDVVISNSLGTITLTGAFNYFDALTSTQTFLDAANITSLGDKGSAATNAIWKGQSSTLPGDLQLRGFNFDGATSGWLGNGSIASPYRLRFDGVNDSLLIPGYSIKAYSIWFRSESLPNGQGLMQYNGGSNTNIGFGTSTLNERYGSNSSRDFAILQNAWYHNVMYFDGSTAYYYLNGVLVSSSSASLDGGQLYNLGTNGSGIYWFTGSISEFITSTAVLTEATVRNLYEASRVRYQTSQATAVVERIYPSQGPAAGGTSVRITGWNLSGATSVTFGGVSASSFSVVSSGAITATTPAGTTGYQNVVVTTPAGTVTLTAAFNYIDPPTGVLAWLDGANIDSLGNKGSGQSSLNWISQVNPMYDGILRNFPFTASAGWIGTGITTDPYRLKFNSANSTGVALSGGTTPAYTISAWFRTENGTSTTQNIWYQNGNTSSNWVGTNLINMRFSTSCTTATTAVTNNTWYHAIATYDGTTTGSFYVNNVLIGTCTGVTPNTSQYFMGADQNMGNVLTGSIGEFHMFSSSFSAGNVTTLWNMTKAKYGY